MTHFWASDLSYDAVMFDFAGVLVPLDRIGEAAFASVATAKGIDAVQSLPSFSTAWNRADPGTTVESVFQSLFGDTEGAKAFVAFNEEFTRRTLTAPEVPGASALLQLLHSAHVPTALISYASRDVLMRQLSVRGWKDYFGTVFSRERFSAPKPDPRCYRTVTVSLGATLGRALAIEHSAVGMEAAHKAGLSLVHVGCMNEARCDAQADFHVMDLNEVAHEVLQLESV